MQCLHLVKHHGRMEGVASRACFRLDRGPDESPVRYRVQRRRYRVELRGNDQQPDVLPLSLPRGAWSRRWDACRECGSTAKPHAGGGLCATCAARRFSRRKRGGKRSHESEYERRRAARRTSGGTPRPILRARRPPELIAFTLRPGHPRTRTAGSRSRARGTLVGPHRTGTWLTRHGRTRPQRGRTRSGHEARPGVQGNRVRWSPSLTEWSHPDIPARFISWNGNLSGLIPIVA